MGRSGIPLQVDRDDARRFLPASLLGHEPVSAIAATRSGCAAGGCSNVKSYAFCPNRWLRDAEVVLVLSFGAIGLVTR
jgi:hypothetical protein